MIKKEYADFSDWSSTSLDMPEENELVTIGYINWIKDSELHKQVINESVAYYKKVANCDSCFEWYLENGDRIFKHEPNVWKPINKGK